MKLYLVRHAEAVERAASLPEAWRYLTVAGRETFRKIARQAEKEGMVPDCILTSPLIRGVQTAELLSEAFTYGGALEVAEELSPGFDQVAFRKLIDRFGHFREVVLVGHEPDLGILAGHLLQVRDGVIFKKGAILALTLDLKGKSPAAFHWMITGKKVRTDLADIIA